MLPDTLVALTRNEYVVLFGRLEMIKEVVLALVVPTLVQLVESSELSIT